MSEILFYFFGAITLVSAIMVISSRNPVHSVLFLIVAFCASAGLLILIEAEFMAMIFIVVYVGAIAVLFLFVVMMLNIKISEVINEYLWSYWVNFPFRGFPYRRQHIFQQVSRDDTNDIYLVNYSWRNIGCGCVILISLVVIQALAIKYGGGG